MKLAVCVMTIVRPIKIRCVVQTEQRTTMNVGISWATAGDWTIIRCTIQEAVRVCALLLYISFITFFVRSLVHLVRRSLQHSVLISFLPSLFHSLTHLFIPTLFYHSEKTIFTRNNAILFWCSLPGFPFLRGRVELLHVPKWSESGCKTVIFPPYRFYPNKDVHVQLTVNHINLNDSVTVHHAITLWTENVNSQNFTVCAMQAGRNGNNFNPFATVDWMAYQGAPIDGVAGKIKVQKWWSGTNCEDVTFPKVRWNL